MGLSPPPPCPKTDNRRGTLLSDLEQIEKKRLARIANERENELLKETMMNERKVQCPACTFCNDLSLSVCEMCGCNL